MNQFYLAFLYIFFCLDCIRSNRPACVAVNKQQQQKSSGSRLCTVDGMFFSFCCFLEIILCRYALFAYSSFGGFFWFSITH